MNSNTWDTALDIAAEQDVETLRYIHSKRKKWNKDALTEALILAVYYEKVTNIRFLLEKGADVSQLETEDIQTLERLLAGEV